MSDGAPAYVPDIVPPEVVEAIRGAGRIALVGHVTPDADALASMGALWLALPELGKTPHLELPPGSVSRQLSFLMDFAALQAGPSDDLLRCDLIVALDTAKLPRLNVAGDVSDLPDVPILNVDHHATNTQFGNCNWVVGQASSTSELVYAIVQSLGCRITPTIATLLYAGIHTDTQGFSLSNTGPNALKVGHALAESGALIHEVCERMHRSHSRGEFELMGIVYRNTRVSEDGRLAWSTATHEEITGAGCTASDIDDQVEIPRSIEGVSVAVLFSEGEPGRIRMNFRGEGDVSVLALAQQFDGGGHHASAGARLRGTMDEITARVLPIAHEYVANLGNKEKL